MKIEEKIAIKWNKESVGIFAIQTIVTIRFNALEPLISSLCPLGRVLSACTQSSMTPAVSAVQRDQYWGKNRPCKLENALKKQAHYWLKFAVYICLPGHGIQLEMSNIETDCLEVSTRKQVKLVSDFPKGSYRFSWLR